MPAYKIKENGTWLVLTYQQNSKGDKVRKAKRGFATKREALEWEREFLQKSASDLTMTFKSFVELYIKDKRHRIREYTWQTKENIIYKKLMPYFKKKKMNDIQTRDIITWQNEMLAYRDDKGKGYSDTYLKSMHSQLSAVLNHAVKHYGLKSNVASRMGAMGKKEASEMLFWTKEEYLKFSAAIKDKELSYYAFEMLYWCGLRLGELLALTPSDFDFNKKTVSVTKSYQRFNREDVITEPKTPKSNRVIIVPQYLCDEIRDYVKTLISERLFPVTKSYLHHEMNRGSKACGVKRIRIHDLRHSHVSLLIEMGFSALAIADRVGHESIDITYRYAHLFPSKQLEMANRLDMERQSAIAYP